MYMWVVTFPIYINLLYMIGYLYKLLLEYYHCLIVFSNCPINNFSNIGKKMGGTRPPEVATGNGYAWMPSFAL